MAGLRAVEVHNKEKDSYGSGSLLAPGLVLTAHHVAKPGEGSTVRVRDLHTSMISEAAVVWESHELDAVLLRADPEFVGGHTSPVRFGEVVCDDERRRPRCTATGFPRAMRHQFPFGSGRSINDSRTIDGSITPHTGSRSKVYGFDITSALPVEVKDWKGMSGAGVFCEGVLVGFLPTVMAKWQGLANVQPIARLLAHRDFVQVLTEATGRRPVLQPADLTHLLEQPAEPRLSSSHLLDPRQQVVELTEMDRLVNGIEQWCRAGGSLDVAAVTGVGGTGKSRMVTEVLERLSRTPTAPGAPHPWSGGFLSEHMNAAEAALIGTCRYPLLIVIDRAETRIAQIRDAMRAMARRFDGSGTVRVLLLARSPDPWWTPLRRTMNAEQICPAATDFTVTADDAFGDLAAADIYEGAKAGFTERLRLLQQARHGDATWSRPVVADVPAQFGARLPAPSRPVIDTHVAALADVLLHANPDFARKDNPYEVVLAQEEEYIRRIAEHHLAGEPYDGKLAKRLIAGQYLCGARTGQEAQAAIRAAHDVHHRGFGATALPDPTRLAAWEKVLSAAYPASDGTHWGRIGEPLAAAWIAEVDTDGGEGFVEHLLQHDALSKNQQHQALSRIAREAEEQPVLAADAHRAVASQPERLLPLAAGLTAELATDRAQDWLHDLEEAVTARDNTDPDVAQWSRTVIANARTQSGAGAIEALLAEESETAPESTMPTPWSASPPVGQRQLLRMHRQMPGWRRPIITFLALGYLLALLAIPAFLALSPAYTGEAWRWQIWLLVPANVGMNLYIATLSSGAGGGLSLRNGPLLAFAVLLASSTGIMLNSALSSPLPTWLGVLLSLAGSATGLFCLVRATQVWLGQERDVPRWLIKQFNAADDADRFSGRKWGAYRKRASLRQLQATLDQARLNDDFLESVLLDYMKASARTDALIALVTGDITPHRREEEVHLQAAIRAAATRGELIAVLEEAGMRVPYIPDFPRLHQP